MNRKILLSVLIILTGLICFVKGQDSNNRTKDGKSSLKLTISVDEKVCAGDEFTLVSRLENTSEKSITINIRKITQLLDEVSFGQSSELLIENSRARFSSIYDLDSPPKNFMVTLEPSEFYEYKYMFKPKKDDFYKSAGRYYIQIVNMQRKEEKEEEASVSFERLDSNKLEFEIKDCLQLKD